MKRYIAALSFALLPASAFAAETPPHTIAVMGEAEMKLAPDYATVDVGVITQGASVADALQENSTKMNRVVSALRSFGISDSDIQTSTFNIRPKYQPRPSGEYDDEAFRPIVGYSISNRVTVTVKDMSKVAKIVDATVVAGANASGEVNFRIKDVQEKMDQVRKAAVESAYHKAQVLTSAAHITLGPALSVTDNQANTYYNERAGNTFETVTVTSSKVETPILPGEVTIVSEVTVVYAAL